jgi:hypothetical protein
VIEYSDYAQFFGKDLILLKSPINGIVLIKLSDKVRSTSNYDGYRMSLYQLKLSRMSKIYSMR